MRIPLFGTMLFMLVLIFPVPIMARVDVDINIALPPLIAFAAPPELIVIPETYVYAVVPDFDVDIYFYNGWWWRPWDGRWYRSRHYNSGWAYYQSVPTFYREIPPRWRNDYRDHRWKGHQWDYKRIPHQQVQQNWNSWEKNRHWENQDTWGVKGLKPGNQSKQPSHAVQPKSKQQYYKSSKPQVSKEVYHQQPQKQYTGKPQKSDPEHDKNEKGKGKNHGKK